MSFASSLQTGLRTLVAYQTGSTDNLFVEQSVTRVEGLLRCKVLSKTGYKEESITSLFQGV